MIDHRLRRPALAVVLALAAPLAALGLASPALAAEHHPKGEFAPFSDCPLSSSATELCVYAQTESGEFVVGKKTVPITSTITLQGGLHENTTTNALEFIGAEDGNTLSKTPQPVPGGLLGIVAPEYLPKFLRELINKLTSEGLAGVTATSELAAPASSIGVNLENLIFEEGTALELPLKVKLSNALLGESCYIGSNAHPIVIPFTTGTTSPPGPNKPIKGSAGEVKLNEAFTLSTVTNNSLVNNSFAAPEAEGCGGLLSFLIDPAVDLELGLPAAAGQNTAILDGTLENANASAVTASE
jgi:hypothetical protein